jgi:hypothetical protein
MGDGSYKFIFESGVVRFDASGNLFVHLRHSKTDAHPCTIDSGVVAALPETERRARFLGSGSGGASGAFTTTEDLTRGFTIELKGYESVSINDDGHLEVVVEGVVDPPDWAAGSELRLGRSGDALRLWAKSSFPDGVTGDGAAPPPKPAPKSKGDGPGPKKPPAEPAKTYNAPEKAEPPAEAKAPSGEKPKTEAMARARGDQLPGKKVKIGATGVKAEGGKSKTTVDTTSRASGSKASDPGGKKKSGGGCAALGVLLLSIVAAVGSLAAIL